RGPDSDDEPEQRVEDEQEDVMGRALPEIGHALAQGSGHVRERVFPDGGQRVGLLGGPDAVVMIVDRRHGSSPRFEADEPQGSSLGPLAAYSERRRHLIPSYKS